MPNNAFSILSFFYNIFVFITFFTKDRLNSLENKIYKYLIVFNTLNILSVLICWFTILMRDSMPLINDFFSKLVLVFYLGWVLLFTLYVYLISYKDTKSQFDKNYLNVKKILIVLFILLTVFIVALPLNYYGVDRVAYSFGPSANVVYITTTVCMILWVIMGIVNYKKLKNKKYLPVLIFIVFVIIATLIQKINPAILLTTAVETFVTVIMYFTVENPDMKMLNEVYKNKELFEQTYEDKSNFLFELTQEVRNPLFNINNVCNRIRDEKDVNKIKEGLKEISTTARQLDFIVNDVLNVSNLSVQKIKFVDNRYNINTLYEELVTKITACKTETVDFRSSITHNIPYLYGDSLKLKQIIMSILLNAVKKTEKGFIEFHIDTIERYDVCRLMITIKDSGSGISIDKINEILAATGELNQEDIKDMEKMDLNMKLCQKVVKLMGGSLMIKSELGKGTEVILVVDQRVYNNPQNTLVNSYESNISSGKKVLLVCQNKEIANQIKKKFNENNITISHNLYGMDAIDKIKSGKKYDYIIIEDEMKEMNGYTTLKELNKINKFNIPVIIMLNKNKNNIKEHYLKDGFKDYMLLEDFSNEINRIINKY